MISDFYVLGIDLSWTDTGLVTLNHGDMFESAAIKTKPDEFENRIDRLIHITEQVMQYAAGCNLVAIEGYAYSRIRGHDMGEIGGIMRYRLQCQDIPWVEISPGQWRKKLFNNGSLRKDALRLATYKKYGVEFDDMNIVEAFGVAMTAWINTKEAISS